MSLKCKFCHAKNCEFDEDELGREKKVCVDCVVKYKKSSKYKRLLTILNKKHGLLERDLEKMSYIGGSVGYHLGYYNAKFTNISKPDIETFCLCGSRIEINCYLKDLNEEDGPVIVIGNCCKEKFLSQIVKKCVECDMAHASKVNLTCRSCVAELKRAEALKLKIAKTKQCACGKMIASRYDKCYRCFISTA